jgi:hypothetical protein
MPRRLGGTTFVRLRFHQKRPETMVQDDVRQWVEHLNASELSASTLRGHHALW